MWCDVRECLLQLNWLFRATCLWPFIRLLELIRLTFFLTLFLLQFFIFKASVNFKMNTQFKQFVVETKFSEPLCTGLYLPKSYYAKYLLIQLTLHETLHFRLILTRLLAQIQRYTYRVLQTIQKKLILLCVWAEQAVFGSAKTVLKFKYEI